MGVSFSFRFIIDRHFFNDCMFNNPKSFYELMHISNSSGDFRREHNLMSEKIRKDIIAKNPTLGEEYIKSALNKVNEPADIEDISDEVTRNILYAIYYTRANPKKVTPMCILTSDNKKSDYLNNAHLKGVKNVEVKSGDEALKLLEEYRKLAFRG